MLNVTGLSKSSSQKLVARLFRDSKKVVDQFGSLLCNILRCLNSRQEINVDELVLFILPQQRLSFLCEPSYSETQEQLRKATTKGDVMKLLESHISWFNHSSLGSFVKKFKVDVESYEDYVENHLNPFLKKSLFEIPSKSSDSFEGSGKFTLKLNIPPSTQKLSANVIIPLKDQVASALALSIDALEFCSYDSGCFELVFSAPYMILKEMLHNNKRLSLVLQNITNIIPDVKIQALIFEDESQVIEPPQEVSYE